MKNKTISYFVCLILLGITICVFSLSFFQCSGKSEEDLIREAIDDIGDYAEKRDIDGVLLFISGDYSDDEERSIEDIEDLLNEYFRRYRGIAVNILGTKILSITVPGAEIETEIALSSGAAKIFRKAVRYSGQFYRFKLKLVKEEKMWKVKGASWKYITLDELFPESFKILKKLFPNVI